MPSLKAIITGDASHFIGQLKMVDSYTDRLALRVKTKLAGDKQLQTYGQSLATRIAAANQNIASGYVPENMTRGGGAGSGNNSKRSNYRVAATMFTSVGRDTFASLASGADPITVFLQQAPQVGQALVMMGGRFAMLTGVIGLSVAAVVALGLGINKFVNTMYDVDNVRGEGLKKRADGYRKLREEADLAREAERKAAEQHLKDLKESTDTESEYWNAVNRNKAAVAGNEADRHKFASLAAQGEVDIASRRLETDPAFQLIKKGISTPQNLPYSEQSRYFKLKSALENAQQSVREEDKRHAESMSKDIVASTSPRQSSTGTPAVTERQRIGLMPVGNAPLLDVARAQLEEQKKTNSLLRARSQDGF